MLSREKRGKRFLNLKEHFFSFSLRPHNGFCFNYENQIPMNIVHDVLFSTVKILFRGIRVYTREQKLLRVAFKSINQVIINSSVDSIGSAVSMTTFASI